MAITAKQLLYQKVIKELHVEGRETNSRIDVRMNGATAFQIGKLRCEAASQVMRQAVEHLAEVAILKLEHVDIHQQPEIVVIVHHLLDLPAKTNERLGFERFVNFVKDRT